MRKAALTAVCGLMPALFLTACNSDNGGMQTNQAAPSAATTPASPASNAPTGSATGGAKGKPGTANATNFASGVALTPADWGQGFTKADDYEDKTITYTVLDASCKYKSETPSASVLGAVSRYVQLPADGAGDKYLATGNSNVTVFSSATEAQKEFDSGKADSKRCPTSFDPESGTTLKGAQELPVTNAGDLDQSYAEVGQQEFTGGGDTGPFPYAYVVARKESVTVSVMVDGESGQTADQTQARAEQAIHAMLLKLKAQAQTHPLTH